MEILNIELVNFRNAKQRKITFDPNLTVIIGDNGVGKSNILEALGLLGNLRTHGVQSDMDLVKFGETEAKIVGNILSSFRSTKEKKSTLTINFVVGDKVRKSFLIDDVKKRQVDFINYFSTIVFAPSDLDLVSGSPSKRRHHMDSILSSVDRDYFRAIRLYHQVVVRRNRVLVRISERQAKQNELDFWDERLVENGRIIFEKRREFFDFLNFVEPESQKGELRWELVASLISTQKLLENRLRDIEVGVTLSGPHRDDFRFIFRDKNLEYFGSRGEQRMAVLALKLSELEYMNSIRGVRPVLALDDIFSELDFDHRETILSIISKQQTIITAAEQKSLPPKIFKMGKVVFLK